MESGNLISGVKVEKNQLNIIYHYFSSLEATLSRPFLRSLTLLRAKSDFHPRKPPLSSDQTSTLLCPLL